MWETIMNYAVEVGLMAGLFVGLLIYILRDTNKREMKYQEMIKHLHTSLSVISEIQKETRAITETLVLLNKEMVEIKHEIKTKPTKNKGEDKK